MTGQVSHAETGREAEAWREPKGPGKSSRFTRQAKGRDNVRRVPSSKRRRRNVKRHDVLYVTAKKAASAPGAGGNAEAARLEG